MHHWFVFDYQAWLIDARYVQTTGHILGALFRHRGQTGKREGNTYKKDQKGYMAAGLETSCRTITQG